MLSDEEIRPAGVEPAQAVDAAAFIAAARIEPAGPEVPCILAPALRGQRIYALLREALRRR